MAAVPLYQAIFNQEPHIQHQDAEYLSYKHVAERADCSVSTVRRLVKAGRITAVYLTSDTPRIPVAELEKLAAAGGAS